MDKKMKSILISGCSFIGIVIVLLVINCMSFCKSEMKNVSRRIYDEAMDYVDGMSDSAVKNEIEEIIKRDQTDKLTDISALIKGRKVLLYVGKKPTREERLLKEIVETLWQYKCAMYAQEVLAEGFEEYENAKIDEAMYMAKGVIYERERILDDISYELGRAENYRDLLVIKESLDSFYKED